MLDLLITRATLPDGRTNMSVAIQDGRIVDVAEGLNVPAFETVDAAGQLLSPPFCDPHFHMDATLELRPAARESKRHPARRHCAVGRAQAAADGTRRSSNGR
jgi:N-acyl-D-aspartate/D-glutamate deacylase